MPVCEKLANCPFYKGEMSMEHGLGAIYKKRYCEEDKDLCARYKIATTLGPQYVRDNFYPNDHEGAERILAKHGKR